MNSFIIGEKIFLRAPEPGDEIIAAKSENHPDPRSALYIGLPSSVEAQKQKLAERQADRNTIWFTVCTVDHDQPVGQTGFVRIDWLGRMATFYIAIAEKDNWSRGFGSEATQLMVDYAFGTLNLNRVHLHVSVENERAVKVYEKIGFRIEGTLRQAMYYNNRYIDFHVMGILKADWEKNK